MPTPPTLVTDLEPLRHLCTLARQAHQRIVLAHGCFDLLHLGHVRYLEAARQLGDVLVVTVTPDTLVHKGPGRPVFNQHERAEMLASLRCVDHVAINRWPTAVETITLLKPHVYAKGVEYREAAQDPATPIAKEQLAIQHVGGVMAFIPTPKLSSTQLLRHLTPLTNNNVTHP